MRGEGGETWEPWQRPGEEGGAGVSKGHVSRARCRARPITGRLCHPLTVFFAAHCMLGSDIWGQANGSPTLQGLCYADESWNEERFHCASLGQCGWKVSNQQVQLSSVAQSCLTLCDPMDCSTPGHFVHHQLLKLAQTPVHWVSDAIQASHPLTSLSPLAFNLCQYQGLF